MIKYIGSKRVLVPLIVEVIQALEPSGTVIDLFSGTSRVGRTFETSRVQGPLQRPPQLRRHDSALYVQADQGPVFEQAERYIDELNRLPGKSGYFTKTFCEDSWYFQPKNGERVNAIRTWIASKNLEPELEAILLVSLMEAADRVDSTTGVQMAYLKLGSKSSQ